MSTCRLEWKRTVSGDWYAFPGTTHLTGNAVAVVYRARPDAYRLMMRDDVNDLAVSVYDAPNAVVGVYPTDDEAKEVADVIYRLQTNVITS